MSAAWLDEGGDGTLWVRTRAARARAMLAARADLITLLGMAPEASQAYADRYAATTGELEWWATERAGIDAVRALLARHRLRPACDW